MPVHFYMIMLTACNVLSGCVECKDLARDDESMERCMACKEGYVRTMDYQCAREFQCFKLHQLTVVQYIGDMNFITGLSTYTLLRQIFFEVYYYLVFKTRDIV